MSVEQLIERLEHSRPNGKDKWIARCPAHQDRSPSLSINALPDGRTLIHCHAGCGANDVLSAVGLEFDVLFPPTEATKYDRVAGRRLGSKSEKKAYYESFLLVCESLRKEGQILTDEELDKELVAFEYLQGCA